MKCVKCGAPAYVNREGIGTQKPYRAKLCESCLRKNFAAIGMTPPMIPEAIAESGEAAEKPKPQRSLRWESVTA